TYTGATLVNAGVLNVQNGQALGAVVNEVQTVTLSGPTSGTFTLTFNGKTTTSLAGNSTAGAVQTELGNLSTIGTTAGVPNVSVSKTGSTFTITFIGPLAGQTQNLITGT